MASFHWSALDTEKERWCMPSLLPPNADPPVWREVLLLECGAPGKQVTDRRKCNVISFVWTPNLVW